MYMYPHRTCTCKRVYNPTTLSHMSSAIGMYDEKILREHCEEPNVVVSTRVYLGIAFKVSLVLFRFCIMVDLRWCD